MANYPTTQNIGSLSVYHNIGKNVSGCLTFKICFFTTVQDLADLDIRDKGVPVAGG